MKFITIKPKISQFSYLDFNATTPPAEFLQTKVGDWLQQWGNPSSIHQVGRGPKTLLRESRQKIAQFIGADSLEIIFTAGGSEANNLALRGSFEYAKLHAQSRNEIIVSSVEHPSLMKSAQSLVAMGAKLHILPVSREGQIDLKSYQNLLCEKTLMVSVMLANNETGTIFPVKEMAALAHARGALFHADCVQAMGKLEFNVKELGVDFASFAGHKFYAFKGAGFLYSARGSNLQTQIYGGGQERHRRGGTENLLAICSLAEMTQFKSEILVQGLRIQKMRDYFESEVLKQISDVSVTASKTLRLPNTSSLVIPGVDGETLLMNLDMRGFGASTGAACSSGSPEPSPTLLALGLSREQAQSSLRVGLGWSTEESEVESFILNLTAVVEHLRSIKNLKLKIYSEAKELHV
jgi:cysteine desulfurase